MCNQSLNKANDGIQLHESYLSFFSTNHKKTNFCISAFLRDGTQHSCGENVIE